jgi:YfiH family protein
MNMHYGGSLALHTGEEAIRIVQNRKRVAEILGVGDTSVFVLANQTHSDHIDIITEASARGWEETESAVADCDGLITAQKGVMLGILTADCVPVLFYDPVCEVVAAVHAGWRGTQANIVAGCVTKMQAHFGSDPKDIVVGIGPSIGKCCYEVGEEVAKHFHPIKGACESKGDGKYLLDLQYINKYQLLKAGVLENHIEHSGICTACNTERFFSYREEQGCSGRFMSLVGMRNN